MKKDLVSDFCHSFLKECFIDTNGCLGVLLMTYSKLRFRLNGAPFSGFRYMKGLGFHEF